MGPWGGGGRQAEEKDVRDVSGGSARLLDSAQEGGLSCVWGGGGEGRHALF